MLQKFRVSFKKLIGFTGKITLKFLFLGVIAGITVFVVEFAFAHILQLFLVKIGVIQESVSRLPTKVMSLTLSGTLIFIFVLGILKSFLIWAQAFLTTTSFEIQRDFQRRRLIRWAFNSENVSMGRLLTLYNDNSLITGQFYTQVQMIFLLVPVTICLWLGLMYLSPPVTLAATLLLSIVGVVFQKLNTKITDAATVFFNEIENINKRIVTNMRNLILLQIYRTGQQEDKIVNKFLDGAFKANMKYQKLFGLKYVAPQILGTVLLCLITYVSVKFQLIEAAVLLTYFYLFMRFAQNFSEVAKNFSSLLFYFPQTKQLYEWWCDYVLPNQEKPIVADDNVPRFQGRLGWELKSVSFSYPGAEKSTIDNLNLNINPGEFLAITGPSGVGKSTILNLLLGMIKPDLGSIKIISEENGVFDQKEKQVSLLKSTGYVGTESYLREGTIIENLVYGLSAPPSTEQIEKSLMLSECSFVLDLPKKLHHFISDHGQGLSAGQKQRLSLARALLRNPSVLILDEATSNLDHKTEEALVKTLQNLKGKLTIVAVTHKGAIVSAADRVFEVV